MIGVFFKKNKALRHGGMKEFGLITENEFVVLVCSAQMQLRSALRVPTKNY